MNILFATSELAPFAKTGGLADVCAALPAQLNQLGHSTAVILPAYREAIESGQPNRRLDVQYEIPIGNKLVPGRTLQSQLPGTNVPVYLVEQDDYFDRPQLYRENGSDYRDNCERFVFFCRAVMETVRILGQPVDILHCNDWPTGLIPAYLGIEYRSQQGFENIATVLTIHNMAYQGQFWHWDMLLTGLDWKFFNWRQMEFFGHLNLLKTGLVFADAINTVSPRYAKEIQTTLLGCGLEGVLAHRRDVLRGILNGVDYSIWNPMTDKCLAVNYGPDDWQVGKAACKQALGKQLDLPVAPEVPLIALIGRLASQKGIELLTSQLERWLKSENVHWVVLGSGEKEYAQSIQALARQYPGKLAARMEFSDELAHQIEAGADIFLMPSQFEPCGLNQLYSLKYGTIPVVRRTGGLADTIVDADAQSLKERTANGFSFEQFHPVALEGALRRVITAFHQPEIWESLVQTGMRQDWSWARSASQYVSLYRETLARTKQAVCNGQHV